MALLELLRPLLLEEDSHRIVKVAQHLQECGLRSVLLDDVEDPKEEGLGADAQHLVHVGVPPLLSPEEVDRDALLERRNLVPREGGDVEQVSGLKHHLRARLRHEGREACAQRGRVQCEVNRGLDRAAVGTERVGVELVHEMRRPQPHALASRDDGKEAAVRVEVRELVVARGGDPQKGPRVHAAVGGEPARLLEVFAQLREEVAHVRGGEVVRGALGRAQRVAVGAEGHPLDRARLPQPVGGTVRPLAHQHLALGEARAQPLDVPPARGPRVGATDDLERLALPLVLLAEALAAHATRLAASHGR